MASAEIKVEMAGEGPLEPLIITEEGDMSVGQREATITQNVTGELSLKEEQEERPGGGKSETSSAAHSSEKQPSNAEDKMGEAGGIQKETVDDDQPTETKKTNDGPNVDAQADVMLRNIEKSEKSSEAEDVQRELFVKRLNLSDQEQEDLKKAHRLSPDFPEALYELLCTLQEGRRLNDQRCSFRLENIPRRRRCHSEPNTNKPAHRVIFSSMTSLQREEFFELVATAQARRLDDQRAQLGRSPPPKDRFRSFRGSIKQLTIVRKPAPVTPPKEDLYNMILATQAQGRLEDQRSRAPGPMDDEDFFSLLLRVQGGRMEEQRTELPCMLQT